MPAGFRHDAEMLRRDAAKMRDAAMRQEMRQPPLSCCRRGER